MHAAKGVALANGGGWHGGHTGGALAAEQVVHTAKTNLDQFLGADECPQQMLLNSMQEAHTMIKASRFMNEKDPHSTAVMLLLQPGRVTWGHCGDSRLYHFRGKQLVRRTVDHSTSSIWLPPAKLLRNRHDPPQSQCAARFAGRTGGSPVSLDEVTELMAGDAFVLCSDGLWGYFDDLELATLVCRQLGPPGPELLIDKARQRRPAAAVITCRWRSSS